MPQDRVEPTGDEDNLAAGCHYGAKLIFWVLSLHASCKCCVLVLMMDASLFSAVAFVPKVVG